MSYPDVETPFGGEEYLLLEWRHSGDLKSGAYNFDEALPNDGLVIYRVIEGDPFTHGDGENMVRVIDATPSPFPFDTLMNFRTEEDFSIEDSAAPFGYDSDVYEYVADASWNWKTTDTTSADFLLSSGSGIKTIYARFMDLAGQLISESSVSINLVEGQNTPPVADAGSNLTLIDDGDGLEWVALDGSRSYDPDGTLVDYQWYESDTLIAEGATPELNLEVGVHTITLVVYDDQGAGDSSAVQVTITAANTPPVADGGGDITVTDTDMNNGESVLLDGSNSFDADGTIVSYDWHEGDTHLAHGASVAVTFGLGIHNVILSATDDLGQVSSDSLVVEVIAGGLSAPDGLTVAVSGSIVSLSWSDNGNNEDGFYIERGTKVKNIIVFTRVAYTGADVTTYTDTLPAGSDYFRVQALTADAVSDYSEAVQVRVKK